MYQEEYEAIPTTELARQDIDTRRRSMVGQSWLGITESEALEHPGLLGLLGDKDLQDKYVKETFRKIGEGSGRKRAMHFSVKRCLKYPRILPVFMGALDSDEEGRGGVIHSYHDLPGHSRLVGIKDE